MTGADLRGFIETFIADFIALPENNNLGPDLPEKAWQDFVVGYSRGDDHLYEYWKTHIGEFHWSPAEAFTLGMSPEGSARGAAAAGPAAAPSEGAAPSESAAPSGDAAKRGAMTRRAPPTSP